MRQIKGETINVLKWTRLAEVDFPDITPEQTEGDQIITISQGSFTTNTQFT